MMMLCKEISRVTSSRELNRKKLKKNQCNNENKTTMKSIRLINQTNLDVLSVR